MTLPRHHSFRVTWCPTRPVKKSLEREKDCQYYAAMHSYALFMCQIYLFHPDFQLVAPGVSAEGSASGARGSFIGHVEEVSGEIQHGCVVSHEKPAKLFM